MRARTLFIAVALPASAALAGTCYVVQPMGGGRAMSAAPAVSAERLRAHVRALSEEFVPRDYAHPQNLNRAAAYIRDELQRGGGRVSVQNFDVRGTTYRNVIASFGPEEGERIVVGTHYDAAGPVPRPPHPRCA